MKIKVLVLGLVFSLLACSANLAAKERRGADLVVTKSDGQQITGELVAVKEASLLLLDSQSGADESVSVDDLRVIKIVRKSKILLGAGEGLLVGALFGALFGAAAGEQEGDMPMSMGESILAGAIIFAVPGVAIGAGIGVLSGKDKVINFEGKSSEEIKAVMEELRSPARITDFQ